MSKKNKVGAHRQYEMFICFGALAGKEVSPQSFTLVFWGVFVSFFFFLTKLTSSLTALPLLALCHGAFRDWKFKVWQGHLQRSGLSVIVTTLPRVQHSVCARGPATPETEPSLWFRQESDGDKRDRNTLSLHNQTVYLAGWRQPTRL